jgi:hypothetical protein
MVHFFNQKSWAEKGLQKAALNSIWAFLPWPAICFHCIEMTGFVAFLQHSLRVYGLPVFFSFIYLSFLQSCLQTEESQASYLTKQPSLMESRWLLTAGTYVWVVVTDTLGRQAGNSHKPHTKRVPVHSSITIFTILGRRVSSVIKTFVMDEKITVQLRSQRPSQRTRWCWASRLIRRTRKNWLKKGVEEAARHMGLLTPLKHLQISRHWISYNKFATRKDTL